MNNSNWNPGSIVLSLAICGMLSGCQMANWQQAAYGPGGVAPGSGQFPGGLPDTIDLGDPAEEFDSLDGSSSSDSTDPRTFESRRPVNPPAGTNPSRSDSDIPGVIDGDSSAPQANNSTVDKAPKRLFVPPLRGPIRLGEPTLSPFPEGRRPAAQPPIAKLEELPEKSFPGLSPQPIPLTKKADPRGSFEFPLRRPEDVLNVSPKIFDPEEGFDLPPLEKTDPAETPVKPEVIDSGPSLPVLEAPILDTPVITQAVPEFDVEVPARILVGEATSVSVRIAAPKDASFKDLKLIVTPGEGLICSSTSNESALTLDCPELASGESHKLTFDLQAVSSGTHEFSVSLKSGEDELAWKKLNLTAQPRLLMTQLVGPDRKPVNGRAEFTLKIENVSQQALGPIEAILEFDSTLVPMEASADAEQKPGQLVWSFPVLHPGELIILQAEYACPVETGNTLVSSHVSIEDGPAQVRQSAVAIQRPAGTLQVEVLDRNDLSTVEREMTALVRVTNRSLQPARDLKVRLESPELLAYTQVAANVAGKQVEIKQEQTEAAYLFALPAELPSEQTVDIEITFTTKKSGDGTLQVDVTSEGLSKPVRASEPFTVTP